MHQGGYSTNPALQRASLAVRPVHSRAPSRAVHRPAPPPVPGVRGPSDRSVGMYLPAIALIEAQHGLITARQLADAGLDPNDVRRLLAAGRLRAPSPRGVRRRATPGRASSRSVQQPLLRIRAARLSLTSTDYAFSHDSSAIVLGHGRARIRARRWSTSPGPRCTATPIRRASSTTSRRTAPGTARRSTDLPVLDRARTALDMVREHGRAHGLAACDAAMRAGVDARAPATC